MAEKETGVIELGELSRHDLQLLEKTPSLLLCALTETEQAVLNALAGADYALSNKGIQRKLAERLLINRRKEWAFNSIGDNLRDILANKSRAKTKADLTAWISAMRTMTARYSTAATRERNLGIWTEQETRDFLDTLPADYLLSFAYGLALELPGEPTIKRALISLKAQGFIGRRVLVDAKNAAELFFINPALKEIVIRTLKPAEKEPKGNG